jgi:hypothetical protein
MWKRLSMTMKNNVLLASCGLLAVPCTSNTIEAVVPTAAVVGDETFSDYAEYFVDVCKQANEKL